MNLQLYQLLELFKVRIRLRMEPLTLRYQVEQELEHTATSADISGLGEGDYTVIVTDGNGCDTSRTFSVALTGIGTLNEAGFKAYPNPANDQLNIVSSNVIQHFRVTDLLGNVVSVASPNAMTTQIATTNLSEGIYVIEVITARGTFVNKINVAH
jgi:hypothetical protein